MFNDEDDSIADCKDAYGMDSTDADVWETYNDPMYQLENRDPDVEVQSIWDMEDDEDE